MFIGHEAEYVSEFAAWDQALGGCPNCSGKVLKGKYGAYCGNECGIMLNKAYGKAFSDLQIKNILSGKKILLKGLISKRFYI